jgi:hypothetical protein
MVGKEGRLPIKRLNRHLLWEGSNDEGRAGNGSAFIIVGEIPNVATFWTVFWQQRDQQARSREGALWMALGLVRR